MPLTTHLPLPATCLAWFLSFICGTGLRGLGRRMEKSLLAWGTWHLLLLGVVTTHTSSLYLVCLPTFVFLYTHTPGRYTLHTTPCCLHTCLCLETLHTCLLPLHPCTPALPHSACTLHDRQDIVALCTHFALHTLPLPATCHHHTFPDVCTRLPALHLPALHACLPGSHVAAFA